MLSICRKCILIIIVKDISNPTSWPLIDICVLYTDLNLMESLEHSHTEMHPTQMCNNVEFHGIRLHVSNMCTFIRFVDIFMAFNLFNSNATKKIQLFATWLQRCSNSLAVFYPSIRIELRLIVISGLVKRYSRTQISNSNNERKKYCFLYWFRGENVFFLSFFSNWCYVLLCRDFRNATHEKHKTSIKYNLMAEEKKKLSQ